LTASTIAASAERSEKTPLTALFLYFEMLACCLAQFSSCASGGAQRVFTPANFRYAVFYMENNQETLPSVAAMTLPIGTGRHEFPSADDWNLAQPVRFASDWQGKDEDPGRETEVRLLWTRETLYLKFRCRYRTLTVFPDGAINGRREQLWNRDVAEVFLQPDPSQPRRYWEFEISPNGMWIDLDIGPEGKRDPKSGIRSRVILNESEKVWTAELALPMQSLTNRFDPTSEWRLNFFRVEGATEPRFYSAWRPTHTAQPNFHVPEAFGILRFVRN
jgi:alpha-galactosidase